MNISKTVGHSAHKLLVLYVFHLYNDRVKHFIDTCIFEDDHVDFIIISNDKSNVFPSPSFHNVVLLFRDNVGYDFGGWSDALLTDNRYEKYERFLFVNSSVSGPFIPSYCALKWTDIYINGLRGNVKLFGSTINTIEQPFDFSHVQSYIFAMNKTTLDFLIECEIFSMTQYAATFEDAIWHREVAMSRKIISNKWNIGSLLPLYKNVDFTFADKQPSEYDISFVGDIMYPTFRHSLWDEYQLVFIKGNRFGM